jgi:cell division protein FtsB
MSRRQKKSVKAPRDPEFCRESHHKGLFGKATGVVLWGFFFFFGVFVIVLAMAVIVPIAPEYQKLRAIEAEHTNAIEEEEALNRKRRQYELEVDALASNQDYLEARARDRGPYYRPGESVIKISE